MFCFGVTAWLVTAWLLFHEEVLYFWSTKQQFYVHTYSKRMDQPGRVANPARGQLNREN